MFNNTTLIQQFKQKKFIMYNSENTVVDKPS